MVLRQCVACNLRVPGSRKACVCGHVFTQSKMIGRKRYSGYRAMLCSRNDARGKKNTTPPLMLRESKKTSTRGSGSLKIPKRKLSKEITTNDERRIKETHGAQKIKLGQRYIDFDSPEFIEKLHDALSDINKKIAKQSSLWMILKSSKC